MRRTTATASFTVLFFILSVSIEGLAQQTAQRFIRETRFLLALPAGYDSDTAARWPLVLFLHGSGESGMDLQKVKSHGPPKLADGAKSYPFILVSPQADVAAGWNSEEIFKLLQYLKKEYRVDRDRVYLTGLSMGGYGTWDIAQKYPNEFAAIAPICGGGDSSLAWKLRNMPIWCFHGAKDNVVPLSESEVMVKAVRSFNPDVRFTVYPEAAHNSWDAAYDNDSLYQWMLSQKKFRYTEKRVVPSLLKEYAGTYVGPQNDTVRIALENGMLMARTKGATIPLKSAGDGSFFINPEAQDELHFVRRKEGVTGFSLLTGRKQWFRRL